MCGSNYSCSYVVLTALLIGYSGIIEIINPSNVKLKYGSLAIVIAVISIVAKEAMYWYTIIEAKRINQMQ